MTKKEYLNKLGEILRWVWKAQNVGMPGADELQSTLQDILGCEETDED